MAHSDLLETRRELLFDDVHGRLRECLCLWYSLLQLLQLILHVLQVRSHPQVEVSTTRVAHSHLVHLTVYARGCVQKSKKKPGVTSIRAKESVRPGTAVALARRAPCSVIQDVYNRRQPRSFRYSLTLQNNAASLTIPVSLTTVV